MRSKLLLLTTFLFLLAIGQISQIGSEHQSTTVINDNSNRGGRGSVLLGGNVTQHDGDIIISGTETFLIKDCTFIQNGGISLEDQGKLVIEDSNLTMVQSNDYQHRIVAQDRTQIEVIASNTSSSHKLYFSLTGSCKVNITYTNMSQSYWSLSSSATIYISSSMLQGEIRCGSSTKAYISDNSTVDYVGGTCCSPEIHISNSTVDEVEGSARSTTYVVDSAVSRISCRSEGKVYVVNSNVGSINVDNDGEVHISWNLTVTVTYDGSPVQGAVVIPVYEHSGQIVAIGVTEATGKTSFILSEEIIKPTERERVGNYTITAAYKNNSEVISGEESIELNESKQEVVSLTAVSTTITIHEGDIVTSGTDTFTIRNYKLFIQDGSITTRDQATFVIENSTLIVMQESDYQFLIGTYNEAEVIIGNSMIFSNKILRIRSYESTRVEITDSTLQYPIRHECRDSSQILFSNASANEVYSYGTATANISNSDINRVYAGGENVTYISESSIGAVQGSYTSAIYVSSSTLSGVDAYSNSTIHILESNVSAGVYSYGQASRIFLMNSTADYVNSYYRGEGTPRVYILNSTVLSRLYCGENGEAWAWRSSIPSTSFSQNGRKYICWQLAVLVTENGQPLQHATVEAFYKHDGSLAISDVTGADGKVKLLLAEKMINSTATEHIGNYTIEVSCGELTCQCARAQDIELTGDKEVTIPVGVHPMASFTYSPLTPFNGEPVNFNATDSYDPDGTIISYSWGFGDDSTGSGKATTHVYSGFGSYTVTLTVTDNDGLTDSTALQVTCTRARVYEIEYDNEPFEVAVLTNSTILGFNFNESLREINVEVSGLEGTIGFCNITMPNELIQDLWNGSCCILVDGLPPLHEEPPVTNGTHTFLYCMYVHSTHEITIVPEFPFFLILPLFMITTLLVAILYRRRHSV